MGVDDFKFRFDPAADGATRVLGPLEGDIMEVVWKLGPATVSQVHKELLKSKDIAYTTVMTTLTRLAKKHLLIQDKTLPSYRYSARFDRAGFDRHVVMSIVEVLTSDYRTLFTECLVSNIEALSPDEREKLRSALAS